MTNNKVLAEDLIKVITKDYHEKTKNKGLLFTTTIGTLYYFKTIFLFKVLNYLIDLCYKYSEDK